MHGDFSRWFGKVPKNQVGILAQEGRILLEADINAQTMLEARWQDLAARAAFGAGVAAIPADNLDAWKVSAASISQGVVTLTVMPGAAWADGLLVELDGDAAKGATVTATPLGPPLQDPPDNLGASGTRDAVILEVWRRSLNGYQVPGDLIEPALGGPDTAERMETAYALRLYRMAEDDNCRTLDLNDQLGNHGHLTVTIAPTTMTAGDCPVVQGGGYTGLEHDLYRIEIADVTTGGPMFKWSQWNGGLVGRGEYISASNKLVLHAGDQAIVRSGLTTCYVEALVFDASSGHWRVAYGATASVDVDAGEIDLAATATFGAPPDASMITNPTDLTDKTWFIRVWNEIRAIADFPTNGTTELRDGIQLAFGGGSAGRFVPGDYWTFPVRAQLDNPTTLLSDAPPFGVHHHRVPLAELHWNGTTATIEDCRIPLHPITATDGCCTHSVGDNITSHGDFTTVQAAIEALPSDGGRVCVLPGTYTENVQVLGKTNVEIIGCGPRSKIIAKAPSDDAATAEPAIYVLDTSGIKIEKLHVEAVRGGIAILLEEDEGAGTSGGDTPVTPFLEDMRIADCEIVAAGGSGIEIRGGHRSEIMHNHVSTADKANDWALITVETSESRIERNVVTVAPGDKPGEFHALGGIWLRGGCESIEVIDNAITGGAGHGVMLGHAAQSKITVASSPKKIFASAIDRIIHLGFVFNKITTEPCVGCGPGPVTFPQPPNSQTPPWVAGDPLTDIRICNNDITDMGISGVGVMGFFPDPGFGVISIDGLEIRHNRISGNIIRGTTDLASGSTPTFGYGAISLADVTDLVVTDNEIRDNGTRALSQVCAIYVQSGAGVEVSRNRIFDNGPVRGHTAAALPHGGVWLDGLYPPLEGEAHTVGRWSAAVHDNDIQSNNGPGLVMRGLGHFSIVANSITTRSSVGTIANKSRAVNVLITNNSMLREVSWASYGAIRDRALELNEPTMKLMVLNKAVKTLTEADAAGARATLKQPALEAWYSPPPGSVTFANNHVNTYAGDGGTIPAVTINCLTDVAVSTNHFATYAPAFHRVTPVSIVGADVHVHDNRFVDTAILASASTFGYTNITTHNTADHCIVANWQKAGIVTPNIERGSTNLCMQVKPLLEEMGMHAGELKA